MSPKAGGGGHCGVSANECSCTQEPKINFGDLTQYLTNGLWFSKAQLSRINELWRLHASDATCMLIPVYKFDRLEVHRIVYRIMLPPLQVLWHLARGHWYDGSLYWTVTRVFSVQSAQFIVTSRMNVLWWLEAVGMMASMASMILWRAESVPWKKNYYANINWGINIKIVAMFGVYETQSKNESKESWCIQREPEGNRQNRKPF
jgi:hypothetical protein